MKYGLWFLGRNGIGGNLLRHRVAFGLCLFLLLGVVAACGSSTGSSGGINSTPSSNAIPDHEVRVMLTDSTIESSITTFSAGIGYSFVVTNKGTSQHSFIIRTRPNGPVTDPHSGVMYATNVLPPGATANFTFTFPLSVPQSQVQFTTEYAGPNANGAGVQIPIEVKQG